ALVETLNTNRALRQRVQDAAQRVASLNERHLRQIGADLHDGPAQLLALALLQLDSAGDGSRNGEALASIRAVLEDAMAEVRAISGGLMLPQIEQAGLNQIVDMAISMHRQRTGTAVEVERKGPAPVELTASEKITIYRFVQ